MTYANSTNQDDERTVYCPSDQQAITIRLLPGTSHIIDHTPCGKKLRIERSIHGGSPQVIELIG